MAHFKKQMVYLIGSGCGSVGRAFASNTRGPWFESNHRQSLNNEQFNCQLLKRRKQRIRGFKKQTVCLIFSHNLAKLYKRKEKVAATNSLPYFFTQLSKTLPK